MNQKDRSNTSNSTKSGLNVLFRLPETAKGDWDIKRLPIQRQIVQSPILNLGSGGSCVMAGTKVLMADGNWKNIESFVGGEKVRTLTGIAHVRALEKIKLGVTRRIMEMCNGTEDPLFISDEHPMWTRFQQDGKEFEWWGVYNFNHYLVEKVNGYGVTLKRDAVPLRFDVPQEHAHIDGWKHVQPIYHVMSPETPLFHLDVDAGGSYIAEGFVISSHVADENGAGVNWKGLSEDLVS